MSEFPKPSCHLQLVLVVRVKTRGVKYDRLTCYKIRGCVFFPQIPVYEALELRIRTACLASVFNKVDVLQS